MHRRGAGDRGHHRTAAARRDLCEAVAGGLLGDAVQTRARRAAGHAAAAVATGGGGLQELVVGRLVGRHPFRGVPFQAALQEVDKVAVLAVQDLGQRLAARRPLAALGVRYATRGVTGVEEEAPPPGHRDKHLGRQAQHLHYAGQLLHLVLAGEEWEARVQLGQDAACKSKNREVDTKLLLIFILFRGYIYICIYIYLPQSFRAVRQAH